MHTSAPAPRLWSKPGPSRQSPRAFVLDRRGPGLADRGLGGPRFRCRFPSCIGWVLSVPALGVGCWLRAASRSVALKCCRLWPGCGAGDSGHHTECYRWVTSLTGLLGSWCTRIYARSRGVLFAGGRIGGVAPGWFPPGLVPLFALRGGAVNRQPCKICMRTTPCCLACAYGAWCDKDRLALARRLLLAALTSRNDPRNRRFMDYTQGWISLELDRWRKTDGR